MKFMLDSLKLFSIIIIPLVFSCSDDTGKNFKEDNERGLTSEQLIQLIKDKGRYNYAGPY